MHQQSQLKTIQSLSYPGSNLLSFQLIQEMSASVPGKSDLKPKHWYFLTLAPGVGKGAANRSYNFQNKVTIKFSIVEILSLSFALHSAAVGNIGAVVGYSKFAKSSEVKSVSVGISEKQSKYGTQRMITIFVNSSSNKYAFGVDCALASSISKQLEWSAKMATELEVARIKEASIRPAYNVQPQQQPMQNVQMQQPMQNVPMPNQGF